MNENTTNKIPILFRKIPTSLGNVSIALEVDDPKIMELISKSYDFDGCIDCYIGQGFDKVYDALCSDAKIRDGV